MIKQMEIKTVGYANLCMVWCLKCAPRGAKRWPHLYKPITSDQVEPSQDLCCDTCDAVIIATEPPVVHARPAEVAEMLFVSDPTPAGQEPGGSGGGGGDATCTLCAYPATTMDESGVQPLCASCKVDEAEYIELRDNPPELTPEMLAAVDRSRERALDEAVARMRATPAAPTHCQHMGACNDHSCSACGPTMKELGESSFSKLHDDPIAFLRQFDSRERSDREAIIVAIASWGGEAVDYVGSFIAETRNRAMILEMLS
jgi:hypothetical protein